MSSGLFYTAESLHPRMCVCMSAFTRQILFFIGMKFTCKLSNNNGFIYTIFLYFVNYIFYILCNKRILNFKSNHWKLCLRTWLVYV